MVILVDKREQKSLDFNFQYVTKVEPTTLSAGDYAVRFEDGYSPRVYFERKAIGDLFGTLGKGHERFKKEILRAKKLNATLIIIIEGTLATILKGYKHSTISGISIFRQLLTFKFFYGVDFICCKDRDEMSFIIYEAFCSIGRMKGKKGAK